jgi:hypothetical protein
VTNQVRRSALDVFFAWPAFSDPVRGQACRDDSAGVRRVHPNRDVHSHSRLEIGNGCSLSIHVDFGELSDRESPCCLLVADSDRVTRCV